MRAVVVVALSALVLGRLEMWSRGRERVLDLCTVLEARQTSRIYSILTGAAVRREGEIYALEGVHAELRGRAVAVDTRVWIDATLARPGLGAGRKIAVSGLWRCHRAGRNAVARLRSELSFSASGRAFRSWLTPEPVDRLTQLREAFRRWMQARLGPWPGLRGLALATWTGDAGGLPEPLRRLYLEGGLLHILALSGQHVAVLALLLGFFGRMMLPLVLCCGPHWTTRFAGLGRTRFLLAAAVLAAASDGLAPLRRAFAMVVLWESLHRRRFHVGTMALIGGSAAAILILDPGLLGSPSFLLSVVATAFIGRLIAGPNRFSSYARAAWVMPVLTAPLSAHFFAKLAWLAPVANFLLGGLWGVVWLPLGFLAPLLGVCFPHSLANGAERLWSGFMAAHQTALQWGPFAYGAVIRPGALEAAAWIALLVISLLPLLAGRTMEWRAIP